MKHPLNIPRLLAEILAAIAMAEMAVMLFLPVVAPGVEGAREAILDATMLSLLSGPVIVWRLIAAMRRAHRDLETIESARPWRLMAGTTGVLALGLMVTAVSVVAANREVEREALARFDKISDGLLSEAQRRINQVRYGLAGVRGVYAASKSVERSEFEAYVASRDLPVEFPGAVGFGFIERVSRADVEVFVAAERADGAPDFAIKSLHRSESAVEHASDLWVIKHCFPKDRNVAAWGLDIGSEPVRREAAERAARTGRPAITGKIALVQDAQKKAGFLYVLPVYRNGTNPTTPENRLASLKGLAYAPLILEDALADMAVASTAGVDFEIFEGEQPSTDTELFDFDKHLAGEKGPIEATSYVGRMFHRSISVPVGGLTWTFVTSTTPTFHATVDRSAPLAIGVVGAILSVMLAASVWTLAKGRAQAIGLARGMTVELAAAKTTLERANVVALEMSERFALATRAGGVGIWEYNLIDGTLTWDEQMFRLYGITAAQFGGAYDAWTAGIHPDDRVRCDHDVQQALRGERAFDNEFRVVWPDGSTRHIRGIASVQRDETGRAVRMVGTNWDVTQKKLDEERLRATNASLEAARQAAEAANKAKSAFLANMSHEIRTPLTAILGFTDLLRDDGDISAAPTHRVRAIETINSAGQHLLTVINDILDLSKIEADKMRMERVETPLTVLLGEVEGLMRHRAESKGLTLKTVLATPVPEHIQSDPTRLRQILMNLLGNAVKFTESGGVSLTAHTEHVGEPKLLIDVEDTGAGITPEQASGLFQAFEQADGTMTRRFGGTGLGLTICRRLASLMGGDTVLLRTEPGKGSCFRLVLPLEPVAGTAMVSSLSRTTMVTASVGDDPRLSGRILLAEDGADNQRLISHHLSKAGATVDIAENGRVALEMIQRAAAASEPYDLLLTDMQMPDMDGYTLARELRDRGVALPIVALTAHAMTEDGGKCLAAGCDDYATKPIDRVALVATCARWMNGATRTSRAA